MSSTPSFQVHPSRGCLSKTRWRLPWQRLVEASHPVRLCPPSLAPPACLQASPHTRRGRVSAALARAATRSALTLWSHALAQG
jgi:hypothetical protein